MHVVSVCLHYGNIIWLPWQRPLTDWKIRYLQIHHLHVKRFHMVKRLRKSVRPVYPEIFDKIAEPQRISICYSLFSAETTGPIFTKILHDIVALVSLFNLIYTRRYSIPFMNARATKVRSLPFFSQNWLPYYGNVP